jgi:hypothetical protein
MARLNLLNLNFGARTHEGAPARNISPELQLRRSVLACLLSESQFYEDGVEIAGRIAELVSKVAAEKVAALAVEGRERMKLRHAPLLLVREMARHRTHRALVSEADTIDGPSRRLPSEGSACMGQSTSRRPQSSRSSSLCMASRPLWMCGQPRECRSESLVPRHL